MRRLAIAGLLGLAVASALLIAFVTGTPARPPAPPAAREEPAAAPAVPATVMDRTPAVIAPAPEQVIAQPAIEPPPEPAAEVEAPALPDEPAAAPVPWESVRPLARGWPALTARIASLQPKSLPCSDHLARGGFRERSRAGQSVAAPVAVLMLHLETLEGAVRIVDVPVERKGDSDDAVIACVQEALRGLTVPMPGTRPGSRQKLPYRLR